jgi:hypothetical protein
MAPAMKASTPVVNFDGCEYSVPIARRGEVGWARQHAGEVVITTTADMVITATTEGGAWRGGLPPADHAGSAPPLALAVRPSPKAPSPDRCRAVAVPSRPWRGAKMPEAVSVAAALH